MLIEQLDLSAGARVQRPDGRDRAPGKSIVVGALGLVLGGRAAPDLVRPGADGGRGRGALRRSRLAARTRASALEAGLESPDDELVLRRVVQSSGRSRAYLNGRLCTAAQLAELAPELVDISSQHESVALTDPATHLEYLDAFAKLEADRVRARGRGRRARRQRASRSPSSSRSSEAAGSARPSCASSSPRSRRSSPAAGEAARARSRARPPAPRRAPGAGRRADAADAPLRQGRRHLRRARPVRRRARLGARARPGARAALRGRRGGAQRARRRGARARPLRRRDRSRSGAAAEVDERLFQLEQAHPPARRRRDAVLAAARSHDRRDRVAGSRARGSPR